MCTTFILLCLMPHASFAQQKTRLQKRNTETEESLRIRLNIAELDMEYGMIKLFVKTSELG